MDMVLFIDIEGHEDTVVTTLYADAYVSVINVVTYVSLGTYVVFVTSTGTNAGLEPNVSVVCVPLRTSKEE